MAGSMVGSFASTSASAKRRDGAAEEDEARRRQVEADREADRVLAEDAQQLAELADLLARAALLAAGYHRPNRGPWRKRRVRKTPAAATPRPVE